MGGAAFGERKFDEWQVGRDQGKKTWMLNLELCKQGPQAVTIFIWIKA
jgi:hypothetical protein